MLRSAPLNGPMTRDLKVLVGEQCTNLWLARRKLTAFPFRTSMSCL